MTKVKLVVIGVNAAGMNAAYQAKRRLSKGLHCETSHH